MYLLSRLIKDFSRDQYNTDLVFEKSRRISTLATVTSGPRLWSDLATGIFCNSHNAVWKYKARM